jgi:phosphoglycolate phosphatase
MTGVLAESGVALGSDLAETADESMARRGPTARPGRIGALAMTLAPDSLAGAVIAFDLDGTLVDTAPDLIGALNSVLGENGLPALPLARARLMVGRGARALIEQGFAADGAPLDPQATPGLVAHFIEVYLARIADESRPFEGVEAALDELAAAGATLAVCTNKRTDLSRALLDALNMTWRFAAVIGADLAPAPKPDARHLLTAITAAGGRSARALMVGDSASDIGAARAAAVPSVVVSFGYTEIPPADLGADVMIDRFDQLADVAARLLGGG